MEVKPEGSIGSRLRLWRVALGLTQAQFAERIGVHIGVLKKYEQGLNIPGGEALAAIARTGVNMTWLLTGEGEMRPEERLETAAMSRRHPSDGLATAIGPPMPIFPDDHAALTVRQPRRWQAIIELIEGIPDEAARNAALEELFARAQNAADLAEMRQAVKTLTAALKKRAKRA